jgi:hypothetical protein
MTSHWQSGEPIGQVPASLGAWQPGRPLGPGPGTEQQSSPGAQHSLPQQSSESPQAPASSQGVGAQESPSQYGALSGHAFPHSPQLRTSLYVRTHLPSQQLMPCSAQVMSQSSAGRVAQ